MGYRFLAQVIKKGNVLFEGSGRTPPRKIIGTTDVLPREFE